MDNKVAMMTNDQNERPFFRGASFTDSWRKWDRVRCRITRDKCENTQRLTISRKTNRVNWYLSRPQKGTIGVKHTTGDCGKTRRGKKLNVGLDRQTQQLAFQITDRRSAITA